ncbi:transposase [Cellulophaga sp. F20128]|uniref:REP-associated tyrosine transposase n=1 Tax=Cellulophaga sp. F20128 TaxID=2926413 RepID=UPI001FF21147|nr:transposase [Cellulophaga sp. F20128]MCK0158857.1 transposase [Cellulophaga sp. F20128]
MFNTDGYKIRDQSKPHFLTFTVVDWIDVFTRKRYKDIIIESLSFCIRKKGMIVYGFVIMSNHIHIIMQSTNGELSSLIADFKKFNSKKVLESIKQEPESRREWMLERFKDATKTHSRNKHYQFWKYGNHPEEIFSGKFLWSKLDYIHLNPVRSGVVVKASHYLYSSASNYVEGDGILDITLADNPVIGDTTKDETFLKSISW